MLLTTPEPDKSHHKYLADLFTVKAEAVEAAEALKAANDEEAAAVAD